MVNCKCIYGIVLYIHSFPHRWWRKPRKAPTCWSGAIRGLLCAWITMQQPEQQNSTNKQHDSLWKTDIPTGEAGNSDTICALSDETERMSRPPVGKYSSDLSIGCCLSRLFHHFTGSTGLCPTALRFLPRLCFLVGGKQAWEKNTTKSSPVSHCLVVLFTAPAILSSYGRVLPN